ncbi:OsmC family protein [Mucilaginibacter sp. R-33]|uniref:OsmC family protein n=1 Tax=unclassified Mucilaginibacter TaxID=2617802 RepID=UPI003CEAB26E
MSKKVEVKYQGKYKSTTKSPLNEEEITVNAVRFTPVDLLASAYGSCLLGTIDYEAHKNQFETPAARSEIVYEIDDVKSKVSEINVKIFLGKEYTAEQKGVIEKAAKEKCHVGNTIDPNIPRKYEFFYNAE